MKPSAASTNSPPSVDTDTILARLSGRWQQEHRRRVRKVSRQLVKERPQAAAEERLVLDLAAHDAALAEVLADVQVELASRVRVLLDNVAVAVSLTKALREVTKVRVAAAKRVEESLIAVGTLRNQRQISPAIARLRAVA